MPAPHRAALCQGLNIRLTMAVAVTLLGWTPARAGGPLFVTAAGQPYRWDTTRPIVYTVDQGSLGSRSHDTAVIMLQKAVQTWQAVPGSALRFEAAPELASEITGDTVGAFLNGVQPGDPSPMLLDSEGSITDTLVGDGASSDILGFSTPYITDDANGRIDLSFSVINGALHDQFSDAFLLGTMTHEIGHFVNLAHSLANAELLTDGDPLNDGLLPALYYRGPNDPGSLAADDAAWLSWLYPSDGAAVYTGEIHGRVLLPDGVTGLQGVHVVARRLGDPHVTAISSVSGFLFRTGGGGSGDPARLGEFVIPGLPPGSYTLEVQPLDPFPSIPVPLAFLVGGPKFWIENSSSHDEPTAFTPIVVSPGTSPPLVDLVLNGESLGEPKAASKQAPNGFPNPQPIDLPVMIAGTIDASTNDSAGPPVGAAPSLQDVYRVTIDKPILVTALLSSGSPTADLDLYVMSEVDSQRAVIGESAEPGTSTELVQLRLPAGRYYFGVHRTGNQGGAYTLELRATLAPDPESAPAPPQISYLLIGDVTTTGAVARWQTTVDAPSVLYYGQPQQEIGSMQPERQHALALSGLAAGSDARAEVRVRPTQGADQLDASFTTAAVAAPDGVPDIRVTQSAQMLDFDVALVTVRLTNQGSGDASQVRLGSISLADGWQPYTRQFTGEGLPDALDAGSIGAGGSGTLAVIVYQQSGSSAPDIEVHGTYSDADGNVRKF